MDDRPLTGRELLPLSYLSQVRYCPRRAALILLDQAWADNEYTASGASGHKVAHAGGIERRDDSVRICDFRVRSEKLGFSGRCDLVEAISDPAGAHLPFLQGALATVPRRVQARQGARGGGVQTFSYVPKPCAWRRRTAASSPRVPCST